MLNCAGTKRPSLIFPIEDGTNSKLNEIKRLHFLSYVSISDTMSPSSQSLSALIGEESVSELDYDSDEYKSMVIDTLRKHNDSDPYEPLIPWVEKTLWWRVLLVTIIVVFGSVGNSLIIISMCKLSQFRSKPTNIFILNRAIGDLITVIFCPIAALITVINEFYVLGPVLCKMEGFIKVTCLSVSSYSLIVLSLDWLLSIVRPFRKRMTIKQSWFALFIIWVISIIMGTPLLFERTLKHRRWSDGAVVELWCKENVQKTIYYWFVLCIALIYIPPAIMTLALVNILCQMSEFEARLRRSYNSSNERLLTMNMRYRRHIISILVIYLLVSIACWTPLQVSIINRFFRRGSYFLDWHNEYNFVCQLIVSLSSALNPLIFSFLSRQFRQIVTRLVLNIRTFLGSIFMGKNIKRVEQTKPKIVSGLGGKQQMRFIRVGARNGRPQALSSVCHHKGKAISSRRSKERRHEQVSRGLSRLSQDNRKYIDNRNIHPVLCSDPQYLRSLGDTNIDPGFVGLQRNSNKSKRVAFDTARPKLESPSSNNNSYQLKSNERARFNKVEECVTKL